MKATATRKPKPKPITSYIPEGRDRAITRARLCALTGLSDRTVRREIEEARRRGAIIINTQDGKGYFQTEDLNEIKRQFEQNERRAMSILAQQKHLRKKLTPAPPPKPPKGKEGPTRGPLHYI